ASPPTGFPHRRQNRSPASNADPHRGHVESASIGEIVAGSARKCRFDSRGLWVLQLVQPDGSALEVPVDDGIAEFPPGDAARKVGATIGLAPARPPSRQ